MTLENLASRKKLHSHADRPSPISKRQEVTCFTTQNGNGDHNDNWIIESDSGSILKSERPVRLRHVSTNRYLVSQKGKASQELTSGMQEVAANDGDNEDAYWVLESVKNPSYVGDVSKLVDALNKIEPDTLVRSDLGQAFSLSDVLPIIQDTHDLLTRLLKYASQLPSELLDQVFPLGEDFVQLCSVIELSSPQDAVRDRAFWIEYIKELQDRIRTYLPYVKSFEFDTASVERRERQLDALISRFEHRMFDAESAAKGADGRGNRKVHQLAAGKCTTLEA